MKKLLLLLFVFSLVSCGVYQNYSDRYRRNYAKRNGETYSKVKNISYKNCKTYKSKNHKYHQRHLRHDGCNEI
jgi:hypothetical protein